MIEEFLAKNSFLADLVEYGVPPKLSSNINHVVLHLKEYGNCSHKLVNPKLACNKGPCKVECPGHCLIATWILAAFKHIQHLQYLNV